MKAILIKYKYLIFAVVIAAFVIFLTADNPIEPINWKKNAKQMYRISSRSVIYSARSGSSMHERMEINGILNFRIYDISGNRIKAGFQISPLQIRNAGKNIGNAESLYSKLFFAEISKDGRFLDFNFSNEIAGEDEKVIEDIVRTFQFIIRKSFFGNWETEENDSRGTFTAVYSGKDYHIEKTKRKYLKIDNEERLLPANEGAEIKKSVLAIEYGKPESWIKNAEGNELIIFNSDGEPLLKVSSAVSLKLIPFEPDKNLAIWNDGIIHDKQIAEWGKASKNTLSLSRAGEIDEYRKKFGDKSFSQVADGLFRKYSGFDVNCLRMLMDYLKFRPGSAAELPEYLLENKLNPDQRVTIVHALERVGSNEAQSALLAIMKGTEFQKESRTQAAIAFGTIEKPSQDAVPVLWDMYDKRGSGEKDADHIASTAVLSLGSMARNIENSNPEYREISRQIKDRIESDLETNPELNTKVALLHAAGNTADEEFMDDITSYFKDDNPRVRSAAITSLAYMEDEIVNDTLNRELDRQDNVNVRNAIVTTLYKKVATEDTVEKIIEELPDEDNDIVRGQMYRYLLKNRELPGVKNALREMLTKETSHEHKKIIHRALSTGKKSSENNE